MGLYSATSSSRHYGRVRTQEHHLDYFSDGVRPFFLRWPPSIMNCSFRLSFQGQALQVIQVDQPEALGEEHTQQYSFNLDTPPLTPNEAQAAPILLGRGSFVSQEPVKLQATTETCTEAPAAPVLLGRESFVGAHGRSQEGPEKSLLTVGTVEVALAAPVLLGRERLTEDGCQVASVKSVPKTESCAETASTAPILLGREGLVGTQARSQDEPEKSLLVGVETCIEVVPTAAVLLGRESFARAQGGLQEELAKSLPSDVGTSDEVVPVALVELLGRESPAETEACAEVSTKAPFILIDRESSEDGSQEELAQLPAETGACAEVPVTAPVVLLCRESFASGSQEKAVGSAFESLKALPFELCRDEDVVVMPSELQTENARISKFADDEPRATFCGRLRLCGWR